MRTSFLPSGVWPVVLTPFLKSGGIDFPAYDRLVEWYINKGASGLFATCQSSEIFQLSFEERLRLVRETVRVAAGRIPVIAAGAIGQTPESIIPQCIALAEAGAEAVVLLTNQGVEPAANEEQFFSAMMEIVGKTPEIDFGLYECPYPEKRLLSPSLVGRLAKTNRFVFFKETSCDPKILQQKLAAAQGTRLGIYVANNPTLLQSLQDGAKGYSGIFANAFPDLLSDLCRVWKSDNERAIALQNFIGPGSVALSAKYPASAKYFLRDILGESIYCRCMDSDQLLVDERRALDQLAALGRQTLPS